MQDLAGRTAVITGGASGVGLAVAQRLAQSEAADVAMSETLSPETADSNLGVAVLCPGFVISKIAESDRDIPEHLVDLEGPSEEAYFMRRAVCDLVAGGIFAGEVAENVPLSWII